MLTEAGLLPGALQKNRGLQVPVHRRSTLRVESTDSVLTRGAEAGDVLRIPINHFEGNYTVDPETLAELRAEDRIVLRYVDNPNGSDRRHRRGVQRGPQRGGAHAPPRAGLPPSCWGPPTAPARSLR